MKFFDLCDAPPTKKPFTLSIFFRTLIFFELTEPPYRTFIPFTFFLINLTISKISEFFGIKPLPIDQTGS